MKKLGVGIIGMGDISRGHVEAFNSLQDRASLVAVCDIDTESAKKVLAKFEVEAAICSDYKELLQRDDISLVSICLPNALHIPVAIEALQAGKNVLCEKPIACSLAEIDRLIEAMDSTGKQAFSVFQARYSNGYRTLSKLIESGILGPIYSGSVEMHWIRYPEYYSGWRGTWEHEKGGCLLTCAIHAIDALLAVMGEPKTIFAKVDAKGHSIETEDTAVIIGVFENNDAFGSISATTNSMEQASGMKLVFENVTALSNSQPYRWAAHPWRFLHKDEQKQDELDNMLIELGHEEDSVSEMGHGPQIRDIVQYFTEGGPRPQVTALEARRSLEFISRAYLSAKTGLPVSSAITRDSPFYETLHGDFFIPGAIKE